MPKITRASLSAAIGGAIARNRAQAMPRKPLSGTSLKNNKKRENILEMLNAAMIEIGRHEMDVEASATAASLPHQRHMSEIEMEDALPPTHQAETFPPHHNTEGPTPPFQQATLDTSAPAAHGAGASRKRKQEEDAVLPTAQEEALLLSSRTETSVPPSTQEDAPDTRDIKRHKPLDSAAATAVNKSAPPVRKHRFSSKKKKKGMETFLGRRYRRPATTAAQTAHFAGDQQPASHHLQELVNEQPPTAAPRLKRKPESPQMDGAFPPVQDDTCIPENDDVHGAVPLEAVPDASNPARANKRPCHRLSRPEELPASDKEVSAASSDQITCFNREQLASHPAEVPQERISTAEDQAEIMRLKLDFIHQCAIYRQKLATLMENEEQRQAERGQALKQYTSLKEIAKTHGLLGVFQGTNECCPFESLLQSAGGSTACGGCGYVSDDEEEEDEEEAPVDANLEASLEEEEEGEDINKLEQKVAEEGELSELEKVRSDINEELKTQHDDLQMVQITQKDFNYDLYNVHYAVSALRQLLGEHGLTHLVGLSPAELEIEDTFAHWYDKEQQPADVALPAVTLQSDSQGDQNY